MSAELRARSDAAPGLIGALLAEQQSLSAVDAFAERHAAGDIPERVRTYEDLIPIGRTPQAGQQLAFRVDLDACTGCKACVTACHSLNGLAHTETWREVGLIVGGDEAHPIQQTVTTTCHHCEDPACLAGCPVQAYEKDPVTGVVRHLDDQCIGCQYCLLKCPYDVPQYHAELGIVRKCDMCTSRLAEGEAPACVQGCPNAAISIEIVDRTGPGEARELLPGLGDAIPDSAYTRPATRYVSRHLPGSLRPADAHRLAPAPAHDPLAAMLVLVQLSVGVLLFDALGIGGAAGRPFRLGLAAAAAACGLAAATLHLGRPLYAFRAFLGWRRSWMSREILAFGAYVPLLVLCFGASAVGAWGVLADRTPPFAAAWLAASRPALEAASLALGAAGTVCSMMIYVDTRRPYWALQRTAPRFAGTLLLLGALGAAAATAAGALAGGGSGRAAVALLAAGLVGAALKVGWEVRSMRAPAAGALSSLGRSARLLRGALRDRVGVRLAAAACGAALAAGAIACGLAQAPTALAACAAAATVVFLLGELVERHLYFTAEASRGMPGH